MSDIEFTLLNRFPQHPPSALRAAILGYETEIVNLYPEAQIIFDKIRQARINSLNGKRLMTFAKIYIAVYFELTHVKNRVETDDTLTEWRKVRITNKENELNWWLNKIDTL